MAELAALLAGEWSVASPGLALGLAAVALALWALGVWRGPLRLEVAAARGGGRLASADPVWLGCGALRALALALVALAAAGPRAQLWRAGPPQSDLDLVIALDASPSMEALDGELEGRRASRLELAKAALAQFIAARPRERIGLVVFGEHAFSAAPLSTDHTQLAAALARVRTGVVGDATALGEALALATRRLRLAQSPAAPAGRRRAVLLITDGRHNAGALAPETAAAIAARDGVRVHAIGIGGDRPVPFAGSGADQPMRVERADLDVRTLRALAQRSGGSFLQIDRPQQLVQATAAIAELASRPLPAPPQLAQSALAPPLLLLALVLLLAESALDSLLLRRLP